MMSHSELRILQLLRAFATDLCTTDLYDVGHADPWSLVRESMSADDMTRSLAYCQGFARACQIATTPNSPPYNVARTLELAAGMGQTFVSEGRTQRTADLQSILETYRRELRAIMAHPLFGQVVPA